MFGYFRDLNLCMLKSCFLRSSKKEQKRREKKLCGETSPITISIIYYLLLLLLLLYICMNGVLVLVLQTRFFEEILASKLNLTN